MIGDRRLRRVTAFEERHGLAGARRTLGSVRGHVGAPHVNARAMSGPLAPDRGAPRLGRGASERWGVWGAISGPPTSSIPDTRIQPRVADVHQEVDDDEDAGH